MASENNSGLFQRFLDWVERSGNRLPQPVTLFAILVLLVLAGSWIAGMAGLSAEHPDPERDEIVAVNLLSSDGIQMIFTEMVDIFTDFPPLGLVLAVMLGVGIAEKSGLVGALLKGFVRSVPSQFLTIAVVVAGMLSSVAADAGYVVLVPLGAVIFYGAGRHPLAGLAAAFAGVSGGFSANIILTGLDPLLAGFTEPASQLIDENYTVNPAANWYFIAAMVPVFGLAGVFVTEKIVEPRLGTYNEAEEAQQPDERNENQGDTNELTSIEKKGILYAGLSMTGILFLIFLMTFPENGILRGPEGEIQPFYDSLVPLMMFLFFVPGLVYGISTKSISSEKDATDMLGRTMSDMGSYIVLAFVAAQFVQYFNWSNIGSITAIKGAQGLESIGFVGIPLLIAFVILSGFINLLIGSASAKWAILAPIFVPMFMQLGLSPELTQMAYRIGDSVTNILTPLLPYFPVIIVFAQRYVKRCGIGTIISIMIPYSVAFFIVSIIMLVCWVWFEIPLGPDAPMYYGG